MSEDSSFDSADFYVAHRMLPEGGDESRGVWVRSEHAELWRAVGGAFWTFDASGEFEADADDTLIVHAVKTVARFDSGRAGYVAAFAAMLEIRREMEGHYGVEIALDEFHPSVQGFLERITPAATDLVVGLGCRVDKGDRKIGERRFARGRAIDLIAAYEPVAAKLIADGW